MPLEAGSPAPVDIILKELRGNLPDGWKVDTVIANSEDFGVPQRQKRAHIVGHSVSLFGPAAFTIPLSLRQASLNNLLAQQQHCVPTFPDSCNV